MNTWFPATAAIPPAGFLLEHIADAVIAIDAAGYIRYWNQAATAIYGWKPNDVLDQLIEDIIPVEQYLGGGNQSQTLSEIQKQGVWRGGVIQHHRDGRRLTIEAATHLLRDSEGSVQCLVAVNRDITARYALEEERRLALIEAQLAQQRFALLADASLALSRDSKSGLTTLASLVVANIADSCLVVVFDANGTSSQITAAGSVKQELIVPALAETLADPLWQGVNELQVISRDDHSPAASSILLKAMGGSTMLVVPLHSDDRHLGYLFVARATTTNQFHVDDCTLFKELAQRAALSISVIRLHEAAQRAVRDAEESQALLESLISAAPVGFALFGLDLRFQVINERLAACNNHTVEAHLGKTLSEVVPMVGAAVEPLVQHVMATGEAIVDVPLVGADLGPPWVGKYWQETFYPVRTRTGQMLGVGVVSVEVTNLKQLELDLAHSQGQLSGVISSAMDAIITVDEQQQIVLFNRAAEQLFGVPAESAIGSSIDCLIPVEYRETHRSHIEIFGQTGEVGGHRLSSQKPLTALHANGSIFPIETSVSQIVVNGTKLYTAILRDVSARLEAEHILRTSEANLRAVFDNTAQSFVLLDLEHRVVLWNALANHRALATTGRPLVVGASILDYTYPSHVAALQDSLAKAASGEAVHVEVSLGSAAQPLWLAFDYIPVRDSFGQIIGICISTLDITMQRIALESIIRSEERFRALVAETSDLIVLLDADLTVRYASPAWERMLGYSVDQWYGRNPLVLIHPEDQPQVEGALSALLTTDHWSDNVTLRLQHAQGHWIWVEVVGTDLLAHPAVQAIVLTIRDITERKQLTAQLLRAQKMESIGRLAGGIAHDFNNLLTAMIGYIGFALDSLPPDIPAYDDILEVQKASGRAAGLTRQLLAFARKQAITPQACDLNNLIIDMERMLHRLISEDVTLITSLSPNLEAVLADPGQIEQVVLNLVVNARDAMPHGGVLRIETTNVQSADLVHKVPNLEPGGYVLLSVSDTGIGMDDHTREHLFEPFFTTKGPEHGSGLGLATCYGIIAQHNGAIDVISKPEAGSTFNVYLPQATKKIQPAEDQLAPAHFADGGETILLVEDDPAVRGLVGRLLRARGYTVFEVGDGEAALASITEMHPPIHLVLADVVMPRLGGFELAARLQTMGLDLPVIFMSGYTNHTVVTANINNQMIYKPFTAASVLHAVRATLDKYGTKHHVLVST